MALHWGSKNLGNAEWLKWSYTVSESIAGWILVFQQIYWIVNSHLEYARSTPKIIYRPNFTCQILNFKRAQKQEIISLINLMFIFVAFVHRVLMLFLLVPFPLYSFSAPAAQSRSAPDQEPFGVSERKPQRKPKRKPVLEPVAAQRQPVRESKRLAVGVAQCEPESIT